MKKFKLITLIAMLMLVAASALAANPLDAFPTINRPITAYDIEKNNYWYGRYLGDLDHKYDDLILMNVIKQKIMYPDCDYSCLVKPLNKLIRRCRNESLRDLARLTLFIINTDMKLTLDTKMLYSQNTAQFFAYINDSVSQTLANAKNRALGAN